MAEQKRIRLSPWIKQSLAAGFALVLLVVIIAWMSGFFAHKIKPGNTDDRQVAAGRTVQAQQRTVPYFAKAMGTIEARTQTQIASRLLARVERVSAIAGQPVRKGDVLIVLDQADIEAQIQQAQAALRATEARLRQANSDLDKLSQLRQQGAATAREAEDAQRMADVARADVNAAEQRVIEAQSQLDYVTVRSPIDGVIVDHHVEQGDLARPGEPLVTIYDPDKLQLVASVPERLAVGLKVGQVVGVEIDAIDLHCQANIAEIVPQAQPGSRAFLVRVTGACPPGVYSGMFGRLLLPLGAEQQIVIPAQAVRTVGQLEMVQVVEDSAGSKSRFVRTGQRSEGMVEILAGLKPGEAVIVPSATQPTQ